MLGNALLGRLGTFVMSHMNGYIRFDRTIEEITNNDK